MSCLAHSAREMHLVASDFLSEDAAVSPSQPLLYPAAFRCCHPFSPSKIDQTTRTHLWGPQLVFRSPASIRGSSREDTRILRAYIKGSRSGPLYPPSRPTCGSPAESGISAVQPRHPIFSEVGMMKWLSAPQASRLVSILQKASCAVVNDIC